MTSITTIQETPGLRASSIVFTSGSSIEINAPAAEVFNIICRGKDYNKWCSWTPQLDFEDLPADGVKIGTKGTLTCWMDAQKKEYKIPVTVRVSSNRISLPSYRIDGLLICIAQITACDPPTTGGSRSPGTFAWQASLMPSWFAVAERVQTVTPVGDDNLKCEVRQWESTSGWGAYILKYVMGIEAQLREVNLTYVRELKDWAERSDRRAPDDNGLAS